MRRIEFILVHCSASDWGSASEIRRWHLRNGWSDIGYQFVILNGWIRPDFYLPAAVGSIEVGRPLDSDPFIDDREIGAHALGYNKNSVGICLIGQKGKFAPEQFRSLGILCSNLMDQFGLKDVGEAIIGHCETAHGAAQGKTCPDFDIGAFRQILAVEKASGRL